MSDKCDKENGNGIKWETPWFGRLQIAGRTLGSITCAAVLVLIYTSWTHEVNAAERDRLLTAALTEMTLAVREMNCLTRMQAQRGGGKLSPDDIGLCRALRK